MDAGALIDDHKVRQRLRSTPSVGRPAVTRALLYRQQIVRSIVGAQVVPVCIDLHRYRTLPATFKNVNELPALFSSSGVLPARWR